MNGKRTQGRARELALCALMCALTSLCSWITIPIGPVPVTLSVTGVLVTGGLLRPRLALMAQAAYLAVGTVGLSVFAGFGAGPGVLFGPTGGYLLAYPLMALVISLVVRKTNITTGIARVLGMAAAFVLCYAMGTAWFCLTTGSGLISALSVTVLPFVLPDAAKIALACVLCRAVPLS